jgi:hypothetical protein
MEAGLNIANLLDNAKLPPIVEQLKTTDVASTLEFFMERAIYWKKRSFGKERLQHPPPTPHDSASVDDKAVIVNERLGRKRCYGCRNNSFVNANLPSILPKSLPWLDKEIRLVDCTPNAILSQYSWNQIENEIRLGHMKFLKECKGMQKSVVPYMIKRLYYCPDKMCGVIEVACKGDAYKIRNELIPLLELPVKIKAMLYSDQPFPVVTTVACADYDVYSIEDFVDMLKMVNPVVEKEVFHVIETVVKDTGGRQIFIRTTKTVVQYIREKGFVLDLAVGETVFDKRIEFMDGQHVSSKDRRIDENT